MNTIIEKIRAEIERLKEKYTNMMPSIQKCSVCDDLLSFLSDLEKEENPVCEGLEEEVKRWLKEGEITDTRYDDYNDNDIESTARHFAQWGAEHAREQMMDEWLKDRDGCFWDGVEEGKKAMREQMMKEAVEGMVTTRSLAGNIVTAHIGHQFNDGQKVRIIIVKEEGK